MTEATRQPVEGVDGRPVERCWTPKPFPTPQELTQFWIADDLRNIQPPGHNPAGFDEVAVLRQVYALCGAGSVLDLGCGWGRLARAFPGDKYLGYDINPAAVAEARELAPEHHFECVAFDDPLPRRDLCVTSSVLLHVDDRNVLGLASRMSRSFGKLLIIEIMQRSIRDSPSQVPAYCRDRADYERLFPSFDVQFEIRKPYAWYREQGRELSYVLFAARD